MLFDEIGTGMRVRAQSATVAVHRRFVEALGDVAWPAASDSILYRPLDLRSGTPLPERLRVYLYRMSDPDAERQAGAFRIEITLPGAGRRRGHFDWSGDSAVLLVGYQPELDVFALWDAGIYDVPEGIAFARNCQVRDQTLYTAMAQGISEQRRRMRGGVNEDIVSATPSNLARAIRRRWALSIERMLVEAAP